MSLKPTESSTRVKERIFHESFEIVTETVPTLATTTTTEFIEPMSPPESEFMINQPALSSRRDGCILENQEDYEFRRCSFEKTRIRTTDSDGVPLTLKNYKFLPGTKCGIIRCKAQYAGPWTKNMHCKCDNFGCRWISHVFQLNDSQYIKLQ